jgi:hypothetical protein
VDRLRIGVIGLGWFGEIHCDAIIGIPNLELAALCTRNRGRLAEMAAKFGVKKTYTDYHAMLADPDIDAVSIVTMWDQHTAPAVAALEAGKHVFLEKPMASTVADCRAKIMAAAAVLEGHPPDRPHLPLQPALPRREGGDRRRAHRPHRVDESSRRNIPRPGRPTILEQDRADRRRRHPRHRPDAVVHRRPDRLGLCPDGRCPRPPLSRHRPDHVPLRRRRHRDARDGLVHAGEDALRHRRAHEHRRHRGLHPDPGHLPEPRHRRRRQVPQPRHDLLADVRGRARRRAPRGVRLLRQLRAAWPQARDRHAGGRDGGARGDARAEESARTGQVVRIS